MRVVFDTTLLVAAARSIRGASYALLARLPDPAFQTVISVAVFTEYRAVLLRPENLRHRTAHEAEGFLDFLISTSQLQEVYFRWRPALPDPDDDLILELAVAARCRYIVTHNLRDFQGADQWGIATVTPGDFLKLIQKTT
ncbi:PIN domain-containing protein [Verrucomicrobiota bacterium]|nr:PIN domain-containing protein [Verrucomicrobiota bacterium]